MATMDSPVSNTILCLDIRPTLSPKDLDGYSTFILNLNRRRLVTETINRLLLCTGLSSATKALLSIPEGNNNWHTHGGNNLRLHLRHPSEFKQSDIHWLMFSIYHFFRPLQYNICGIIDMKRQTSRDRSWRLICKNNIIVFEISHKNTLKNTYPWNPKSSEIEIRRLLLDIMKQVLKQSGLSEWTVLPSPDNESHISARQRKIYLSSDRLLDYTKRIGLQGFVNMIKKRIYQVSYQ
jgi:hypothetical protein